MSPSLGGRTLSQAGTEIVSMHINLTDLDEMASGNSPHDIIGNEILPELVWIQREITLKHSIQVARYAEALGRYAGFPEQHVRMIHTSALLHDLGKVALSEDILEKNGKLSTEEYAYIQNHCHLGYEFLSQFPDLSEHALAVRHHHERWDGNGYPDGLAKLEIPLASRIIHLADSIDAMLRPRSYKRSMPLEWVLSEMDRCRGLQFDPELTDLTVKWIRAGNLLQYQIAQAA